MKFERAPFLLEPNLYALDSFKKSASWELPIVATQAEYGAVFMRSWSAKLLPHINNWLNMQDMGPETEDLLRRAFEEDKVTMNMSGGRRDQQVPAMAIIGVIRAALIGQRIQQIGEEETLKEIM